MQFDEAGLIVGKVKWYWCAPGAKILPVANSFSSDNWTPVNNSTLGLGEVWNSPRSWRNGSLRVVPPGDGHICGGDISWFTEGCPSDAPPIPRTADGLAACCLTGGLLLGGSYKLRFGGGLLLSGSNDAAPPVATCQPWDAAGVASATLFRVSTGTFWTLAFSSPTQVIFYDPLTTPGTFGAVFNNAGGICTGGMPKTGGTVNHFGIISFATAFVSYNSSTHIGVWHTGTTISIYPNETFNLFLP